MKFFVYNEELDAVIQEIVARAKHLKSGEVSAQLKDLGIEYRLNYGVSLVHLRSLAKEFADNDSAELADRLWHLEYRETQILATMLVNPAEIEDSIIEKWSEHITNIEIAEQIAFNLLGKRENSDSLLQKWLDDEATYVKYAALMSIGWQFRFLQDQQSNILFENIEKVKIMIISPELTRAATHCLKMAGRFNEKIRSQILDIANELKLEESTLLQQAADEIIFEIEMV